MPRNAPVSKAVVAQIALESKRYPICFWQKCNNVRFITTIPVDPPPAIVKSTGRIKSMKYRNNHQIKPNNPLGLAGIITASNLMPAMVTSVPGTRATRQKRAAIKPIISIAGRARNTPLVFKDRTSETTGATVSNLLCQCAISPSAALMLVKSLAAYSHMSVPPFCANFSMLGTWPNPPQLNPPSASFQSLGR